jgi:hypothetical protein
MQERVITGEEVAEHIEMGGREAREKLAMKLPKFGAPQTMKPARRTDSLLSEVYSWPSPLAASIHLQHSHAHGRGNTITGQAGGLSYDACSDALDLQNHGV